MSRQARPRLPSVLLAAGVFSLAWFSGGPAWGARFGSIEISAQPQPAVEGSPPQNHWGGYLEHRLLLRNDSKTVDHRVRLIQPYQPPGGVYNEDLERNSRTVEVPRQSQLVVSLFQPAIPLLNETIAIEIDGVRQKGAMELPSPFSHLTGSNWYSSGLPDGTYIYNQPSKPNLIVLTGRGISQDLRDKVHDAHGDDIAFCRSEAPCGEWSPNWLGYTAYDVILLTRAEAESLPSDVLSALRRYAQAGGIILVKDAEGTTQRDKIVPEALREGASQPDEEGVMRLGFGIVRPCPRQRVWPSEFWRRLMSEPFAPTDPAVQLVHHVTVPVRGLLLVVVCFAVGVGPVNVWLLGRKQKRMWLWWTVPAISLLTCTTIFAYALASEGFTGHGRTALLTLLDENSHNATTLGYVSYYCPMTPGDGLHFAYDTEVVQLRSREALGGGSQPKTLDWTNDQHLDSGWVVARVPACLGIRRSESRRERLAVHREADGTIKVVNGLGMPISMLTYADDDGEIYIGEDLPAGQERSLRKTGRKATGETAEAAPISGDAAANQPPASPPMPTVFAVPPAGAPGEAIIELDEEADPQFAQQAAAPASVFPGTLRALFEMGWAVAMHELQASPDKYLQPGCYVAVVGQSNFLDDPLPSAAQEKSFGVIYGIGARTGDGR